jgi:hypothetical protein
MTDAKSGGISKTRFIVGIIVAILVSSLTTMGALTVAGLVKTRSEYGINQTYVKMIRFYTPNETSNNQLEWKDAAVFTWIPQNIQDNAVLDATFYFKGLKWNASGVYRILLNDNFVVGPRASMIGAMDYQQYFVNHFSDFKPNLGNYTIRFQILCDNTELGPVYVKDINIILEVMDGLPAA